MFFFYGGGLKLHCLHACRFISSPVYCWSFPNQKPFKSVWYVILSFKIHLGFWLKWLRHDLSSNYSKLTLPFVTLIFSLVTCFYIFSFCFIWSIYFNNSNEEREDFITLNFLKYRKLCEIVLWKILWFSFCLYVKSMVLKVWDSLTIL